MNSSLDRQMKIVIIYLGSSEGLGEYTCEIAKGLSKNCTIIAYLSKRNPLLYKWESIGITIRLFDTYNGFKSLALSFLTQNKIKKVATALNRDAPNLIFDTMPSPWQRSIKNKLSPDIPWTAIIHDPIPHPDRWKLLVKINETFNPIKADALIGISKYSASLISNIHPKPSLIESKHGAYKFITNVNKDEIANYHATNNNKFIFIGRIEAYKGVEILISAFEQAKKEKPDIELTIVGRGPLDKTAKETLLNNQGKLLNEWVSDEIMLSELDNHGVMVLPYLSATQSGPASIALARGIPCIATNVGALPEQIQNGKNGLIIEPNNIKHLSEAMLNLASNPSAVAKMSREAFKLAETEYSWDVIANKLFLDFETIIVKTKGTYG